MNMKKTMMVLTSLATMGLSLVGASSFQVVDAKIGANSLNQDVVSKSTKLNTPGEATQVVLKSTALTLSRQGQDQWFPLNGNQANTGVMAMVNDQEPNKTFYLVAIKEAIKNKKMPVSKQSVVGFDAISKTWTTYLTNDQLPGTNTKFDHKEIKGVHHGILMGESLHANHDGKNVTITKSYYDMFWDKDKQAFGYKLLDTVKQTVPQDKTHRR